ncbi:hypothetical protein ACTFIW_008807 [Dictyostelium discoideum]
MLNQTDIVNDPFITRIMTGIENLRPSSAKYKRDIWCKVILKYNFTLFIITLLIIGVRVIIITLSTVIGIRRKHMFFHESGRCTTTRSFIIIKSGGHILITCFC